MRTAVRVSAGSYQGTYIDPSKSKLRDLIENIEHPQISTADQRRQLDLLARWNVRHRKARLDDRLDARIHSYELAFRMQDAASEAFDISREPAHTQRMYGSGVHARQTLIARRLLERGVRFVQLWHGAGQPWDNHTEIKANHSRLAAEIDQPIAALITDLKQRGMLEDTLILWGGGVRSHAHRRTRWRWKAVGPRPQPLRASAVWSAGGGIKGGTVYARTDDSASRLRRTPPASTTSTPPQCCICSASITRLTLSLRRSRLPLRPTHGEVIHDILA